MTTAKTTKKKLEGAYIEAVGRRKTAIARVRMQSADKNAMTVNGKDVKNYFGTDDLRHAVLAPITREGVEAKFTVSALVQGGGVRAQAEAIRHALSRALVKNDETQKGELKKLGFLKRDSRKKERKHFGLKAARKASQWSKR
jgi:small subunit ribosomal protein S9